jgi:hypothetical protein
MPDSLRLRPRRPHLALRAPLALAPLLLAAISLAAPPQWRLDDSGTPIDGQRIAIELPPPPLRIAILPDRTTGRDWGLPYLETAVADLLRLRPDVVFTIGDMVQGYTRSTERWDAEVDEWFDLVSPLPMPLLPTAGNHDLVPGTRDPADGTFVERYRERFGPLHYLAELPGASVIVLNTEEGRGLDGPQLSPAQLEWLGGALRRAAEREQPILLLMHRPLWRSPTARWDELIHPLLARHGVSAVIAGHFHSLQRDPDRDGVQHHILAVAGGAIDQHPFTGQFHHLTLVTLPPRPRPGEPPFSIHHQIVGATVGDAFVSAADQNRAWRLKSGARTVRIEGALPDGDRSPPRDAVTLRLSNPIDRPIEVTWASLDAPPGPDPVAGLPWLSFTPIDTFNRYTMTVGGPVRAGAAGPITLEAGSTVSIPLDLEIDEIPAPWPPPEIRVVATFTDDAGRRVPIVLPRRVPIARSVELRRPEHAGVRWHSAPLGVSAWAFSVYDTLEPDPFCRVGLDAEGSLEIEVTVPDTLLATPFEDPRIDETRLRNPFHDAVALRFRAGDGESWWLLELVAPDSPAPLGTIAHRWVRAKDGELRPSTAIGLSATATRVETIPIVDGGGLAESWSGWRMRISLPQSTWAALGDDPTGRSSRLDLQVGVADNDDTYHTQWRWLAPEGAPLALRLLGEVDAGEDRSSNE